MTKLSLAAQAVLFAWSDVAVQRGDPTPIEQRALSAALRATADQLTPYTVSEMEGAAFARNKLLAIAAELEAL